MKYQYIRCCIIITVAIIFTLSSCKKQDDYLAAIPNSSLSVPSTLQDLDLLLKNDYVFNGANPALGVLSSDEYYILPSTWLSSSQFEQNAYTWARDIYPNQAVADWTDTYNEIYNANVVLDALSTIKYTSGEQAKYNAVKGRALFFRSVTFFNLMQLFASPYDSATAAKDLGIPLRLSADLNSKSFRAPSQQCYNQLLQDLQLAITLLPATSDYPTQPTSLAATAFLARVYLAMGNYAKAGEFANASLGINNTLSDYNNFITTNYVLTNSAQFPLSEMLYLSKLTNYSPFSFTRGIVDSSLYQSYESADLRKTYFFQTYSGQIRFRGSYYFKKNGYLFDGMANDELYLIRAECYARQGDVNAAMKDLNALLIKRYRTGSFTNRTAANAEDALKQILVERRKELLFRGLRWTDLRRLNKDPRFAVTLKRVVNGLVYTLPPNDPRYTFAIPDQEIQLSGLPQNAR